MKVPSVKSNSGLPVIKKAISSKVNSSLPPILPTSSNPSVITNKQTNSDVVSPKPVPVIGRPSSLSPRLAVTPRSPTISPVLPTLPSISSISSPKPSSNLPAISSPKPSAISSPKPSSNLPAISKVASVLPVVSPKVASVLPVVSPKVASVLPVVSPKVASVLPVVSPKPSSNLPSISKVTSVLPAISPKVANVLPAISPKVASVLPVVSPKVASVLPVVSPKVASVLPVVSPKAASVLPVVSKVAVARVLPVVSKVAVARVGNLQAITSPRVGNLQAITSPRVGNLPAITSPRVGNLPAITSPRVGNLPAITSPSVSIVGNLPAITSPSVSRVGNLQAIRDINVVIPQKKIVKLPSPIAESVSKSLEIAQKGVEIALDVEPDAGFQIGLATISRLANLPTSKKRGAGGKIKIPRAAGSVLKVTKPKNGKSANNFEGSLQSRLPDDATIIPPSKIQIVKTVNKEKDNEKEKELISIINGINVNKLVPGRVSGKSEAYNVNDLKSIAGSLGLVKTGKKNELVDRIKEKILSMKPNAFDV